MDEHCRLSARKGSLWNAAGPELGTSDLMGIADEALNKRTSYIGGKVLDIRGSKVGSVIGRHN